MTTNNMYRVGDFVYFETSVTAPYQIRKIEELNKTPQGAVEAKAICYYRRRDISKNLIQQAEKHRFLEDEEFFKEEDSPSSSPKLQNPKSTDIIDAGYFKDSHMLNPIQNHQAKHRELFLSRQIETLPATHIRGKCNVTLYNDAEPIFDYLNKEDTFFYKFTYDPSQKTLHADRNAIRVGSDFQTQVKPYMDKSSDSSQQPEHTEGELVFYPSKSDEDKIQQLIMITRSLGTLARAYEPQSNANTPELIFSAASASRDFSQQKAHDYWFQSGRSLSTAISLLLPDNCPKLFKDELEQWSAAEYSLFQQGIDKYGKDFYAIRNQLMPWKSLKGIIEYYYMWKSTDKYWSNKRHKVNNVTDHKLKQVYIPSFLKPNPAVLCTKPLEPNSHGCESCLATKSPQWYSWGPPHLSCRLCVSCWSYWKRYGGLRNPGSRDFSLDAVPETGLNLVNGESNNDNLNQVGNFKCTQTSCDKEFRVKSQLIRHLHNTHGISQTGIVNGSWDILNQYSRPLTIGSNMNHLMNFPTGRGMIKPRSTMVFKINLRFRLGRVLLSQHIKPRRIARKPNCPDSSDIETIFKRIEKIPIQNLPPDSLKSILKYTLKCKPVNEIVDNMWKRKGSAHSLILPAYISPSFLDNSDNCFNRIVAPLATNGVYDSNTQGLSLKRPFSLNGVMDEFESPPAKMGRKLMDNGINPPSTAAPVNDADDNNGIADDLVDSNDTSTAKPHMLQSVM